MLMRRTRFAHRTALSNIEGWKSVAALFFLGALLITILFPSILVFLRLTGRQPTGPIPAWYWIVAVTIALLIVLLEVTSNKRHLGDVLLGIVYLFFGLALIGGLIIDPFLRWVGHSPASPQPIWLTVLAAVVLSSALLLDRLRGRRRRD